MANWHGTARTNYVRFKNQAAFDAAKEIVVNCGMGWHAGDPLCAMFSGDEDSGSFNWAYYATVEDGEEDGDDEELIDYSASDIATLMEPGQVLVLMEAGAEKLRYVSGYAQAWNHEGRYVDVSLTSIYTLSLKEFGVEPTIVEYEEQPKPKGN